MRLAIDGGRPVRDTFLPYARQLVDEDDVRAVVEVLRSDRLTTGPQVERFEKSFASYVGAKYAIAMSSGTAGLHAATFATKLGPSDEAITTPLTFVASANCVLYQQARPVFADVQSDTLNIDPAQIESKITSRTKVLIPVDYAGQPADLDEIRTIAARHRLVVIEDAAHALGATYKDRRVGTLADMTVFSTHPVKHITTGEGGVVVTDDPELARQLRIFRNHGITTEARERHEWFYEMVALGYNYRLTDIQCALGLAQLHKLDDWLKRRRVIASRYNKGFGGVPEVEIPTVRSDREPSWHLYVIRLNLEQLRVGRDVVFKALRSENIGVNVHYIPVPWHPYYRRLGYERGQWPVAEREYECLITLPMFAAMTHSDVDDVIAAVTKVVTAYRI
jgi:UDP-4-amino-4,6-dideoxy-N-acetyl-beta-L-altrosamine transaminase